MGEFRSCSWRMHEEWKRPPLGNNIRVSLFPGDVTSQTATQPGAELKV